MKKWLKNILIGLGILVGVLFFAFCCYMFFMSFIGKIEVYEDISHYEEYMSFSGNDKWRKWGMDEDIWPRKITNDMNVVDYKMIRYDPRDVQYLGYLVVEYTGKEYEKERERLKNYNSTEYLGYYGVTGITGYELLAMYADKYNGFVYALTDGKSTIIYVELIFCNYFMDLNYKEYIPGGYLLDGFDASIDNPYRTEILKEISDKNLF